MCSCSMGGVGSGVMDVGVVRWAACLAVCSVVVEVDESSFTAVVVVVVVGIEGRRSGCG